MNNISTKLSELEKICYEHPVNIPLKVAAEYDGIDVETLRTSLKNRQCPFGYFANGGYRARFIIPTLPWYLFHTCGVIEGKADESN